jgi:hypothetical protein
VGFGNNGLAKANLHGANDQKVLAGGDRESVGAGFTDSGTTHTLVGAVLGVGLARGMAALNLRVIGTIAMSWLITLPAGAGLAILFFFMFKGMFG